MCGIIGYNGFRNADKVLLDSLKRLEYRGYDSAGVGIIDKKIQIFKDIGDISNLEKKIPNIIGDIGIGHVRWATHGAVEKINAHPHLSQNGKIAIVHNGIIDNFMLLKETLINKGYNFNTNTDTELAAYLIQDLYDGNLEDAVLKACKKIKGSYAIVVVSQDEPEKIVGARKQSPLVIGVGDNENFIASDITAFLKYTNRVIFLEEGEFCVLTKNTIEIFDENKNFINKEAHIIKWNVKDSEKAGFSHFMLKEIYDQQETVNLTLSGRVSELEQNIRFNERVEKIFNGNIKSIHIIACGTSYYSGLAGKYIIEKLTNIPVYVEIASEYRFFGTRDKNSLVIAITQSGETLDTLAALKEAKNSGCKTLVITNVIGNTATRLSDGYILQQSGPEIGVAATKTFTSQILVMYLLGLKLGKKFDKIGSSELYRHIHDLKDISRQIRIILDNTDEIINIAEKIKNAQSVFYIGRGINYPLSLEGALKLKEISYIHAEGFAAGELKHGPFALLTKETPVIAIITQDKTYDKMIANIGEIKARGSKVIAICEENDIEIEKHADYIIRVPSKTRLSSCIPISVVLQLLAYYIANFRKCSIDKPRNLAKSVTVE